MAVVEELRDAGVSWPDIAGDLSALPLAGQTWVVTGKLEALDRDEARARLQALGAKVAGSVSAENHLRRGGPGCRQQARQGPGARRGGYRRGRFPRPVGRTRRHPVSPGPVRALGRLSLLLFLAALAGCTTSPPRDTDNICAIFFEKDDWYQDAARARDKWDSGIPVMMAIIHQESRFKADAKPPPDDSRHHSLDRAPPAPTATARQRPRPGTVRAATRGVVARTGTSSPMPSTLSAGITDQSLNRSGIAPGGFLRALSCVPRGSRRLQPRHLPQQALVDGCGAQGRGPGQPLTRSNCWFARKNSRPATAGSPTGSDCRTGSGRLEENRGNSAGAGCKAGTAVTQFRRASTSENDLKTNRQPS